MASEAEGAPGPWAPLGSGGEGDGSGPRIARGLPLDVVSAMARLERDNERLRRGSAQLSEQVRALVVLQEIANTLSAEVDERPLLRRIAMAAIRLSGAAAAAVYRVDAPRQLLVAEAVEDAKSAADSGIFGAMDALDLVELDDDSDPERPTLPVPESVAGWVAATGASVLIADAEHDGRFPPESVARDLALLRVRARGLLALPLVYKGSVTGVLEVAQAAAGGARPDGFDTRTLDLLHTLAAQAAVAMANARLYRSLRRERDRILLAQEDERKRLARDLHDGPAQKLAQIAMSLEHAQQLLQRDPAHLPEELAATREKAVQTTRDLRNLLFDLRPLVLDADAGGLVAALEHLVGRYTSGPDAPGPQMHLEADYPERLSHNVELTVFAIVQEAVNNVVKHAGAANCRIEVRETPERLVALVRDDGVGFPVRQVQADYETRGSWGLLNMRERAALIEATLQIGSQPGTGTVVSLDVPRG